MGKYRMLDEILEHNSRDMYSNHNKLHHAVRTYLFYGQISDYVH